MSRAWSWRNAILATDLEATTKHVLMVISVHMNDMGEGCYPSVKRLAELASLSERSICTHIEKAEFAGWLLVKRHGFNGQGWARHEYQPLWPEGAEPASAPQGTERGAEGTEPDDKKALKEVQSIEPPIEYPSKHHKDKPKKATRRDHASRSIAVALEDLTDIPDELRHRADRYALNDVIGEWAKFRNHHISVRSRHTRLDLAWDTWCRNAAKWQRGSAANGQGGAGRGGAKRHDHMAAATDTVLRDMFGVDRSASRGTDKGPDGVGAPFDAGSHGDGGPAAQAMPLDAGPGLEAIEHKP